MKKSTYFEFIGLAAIWGSSFLFTRASAVEFGVVPTAAMRVGLAALFLLPLLIWSGHWPDFKKRAGSIMFVGILNAGIPFALFAYAVMSITTGLSAILNATVPLFGAIVAWLWLNDKPSGSRIAGLAIGFIGVAMLAGDKASFKPGGSGWAILACLCATICYAISASYTKRYLMGVPPMATAAGSMMGATLGLALPAAWLWPAQLPSLHAWTAMVVLALVCTGIAYVLYFRLIETAGPSRALTVTFMVPVFALLYGALFLGENITLWMVLCGCVIICGTMLATGLVKLRWLERAA